MGEEAVTVGEVTMFWEKYVLALCSYSLLELAMVLVLVRRVTLALV